MDKNTNSKLMGYADEVLREDNCPLFKKKSTTIFSSYNGQVSALGVSILMIGLKPTVSVYYQDKRKEHEAYRQCLLGVIAKMLEKDDKWKPKLAKGASYENYAKELTRYILKNDNDTLKTDILNCSIALKQVIRTYNLE